MTISCAGLLLAGCVEAVAPIEGPLFCDIEEPRPFPSPEVIDYRIVQDRDNLVRDVRTNENYEAFCQ